MEYGLGLQSITEYTKSIGLNPSFSGIWSRIGYVEHVVRSFHVLILLLVEYGLGLKKAHSCITAFTVLILLLVEYGLGFDKLDAETTFADTS